MLPHQYSLFPDQISYGTAYDRRRTISFGSGSSVLKLQPSTAPPICDQKETRSKSHFCLCACRVENDNFPYGRHYFLVFPFVRILYCSHIVKLPEKRQTIQNTPQVSSPVYSATSGFRKIRNKKYGGLDYCVYLRVICNLEKKIWIKLMKI